MEELQRKRNLLGVEVHAQNVLFLATDRSSRTTGAMIAVDTPVAGEGGPVLDEHGTAGILARLQPRFCSEAHQAAMFSACGHSWSGHW